MNDTIWTLTKRELQSTARSPRFWIGLACVVLVLSISDAFGAGEAINLPQRLAYFTLVAITTFFLATAIIAPITVYGEMRGRAWYINCLFGSLFASAALIPYMYVINCYIAEVQPPGAATFLELAGLVFTTVLCVTCLRHLILNGLRPEPIQRVTEADASKTPLLERVSPGKRGKILSLQAQDHYVEVTTDRGTELVLIRLADAILEIGETEGRRVHRSWWVARDAVAQKISRDNRLFLRLKDGRDVPVSRANSRETRSWVS